MKNQKFKVGDKVYCPSTTTKICTVEEFGDVLCVSRNNKERAPFNQHGISTITRMQFALHANQENHALLEKLYGVEFEAPTEPKTPKEVIQAMLDYGWESVPCYVENSTISSRDFIIEIDSESDFVGRSVWSKATPFDPKTGKIIIDFVDGKEITE